MELFCFKLPELSFFILLSFDEAIVVEEFDDRTFLNQVMECDFNFLQELDLVNRTVGLNFTKFNKLADIVIDYFSISARGPKSGQLNVKGRLLDVLACPAAEARSTSCNFNIDSSRT